MEKYIKRQCTLVFDKKKINKNNKKEKRYKFEVNCYLVHVTHFKVHFYLVHMIPKNEKCTKWQCTMVFGK